MPPALRKRYQTRPFANIFSPLQQAERAARTPKEWRWRRAYRWGVALLTGIVAGTVAFGLNWVTEALQLLKFKAAARHISPGGGDRTVSEVTEVPS
jgi:hypothetical protein